MQEITRNTTTLDRDLPPRIPVDRVYSAVKQLGSGAEFSSHDIARILDVREYKVRAGVGWLLKRNMLVEVGYRIKRNQRTLLPYRVKQYRLKEEIGVSTDFNALMAAFCR
jgi:hypothetical protein